jgi:hypothetical protein
MFQKRTFSILVVVALVIQTFALMLNTTKSQAAPQITAAQINTYLASKNSPLTGYGDAFVVSGRNHGVDPRLIVAIAGAESGFGKANCQSWSASSLYNAWGYMYWPDGIMTCKPFANWEQGIEVVSWQIGSSSLYFKDGLTTVASIGARYCGPGCTDWVNNVTFFYTEMGGDLSNLTFTENSGGYTYNRMATIAWALANNDNCACPRGDSEGRYGTTYVGRALNAGGLNTSTTWVGNQQIIQWMIANPNTWEEKPLDQLVEGDFVLYSEYSNAPGNWSYVDAVGGWSLWGQVALVISPGRVAAWNYEYKNIGITSFIGMPYYKGVHIRDNAPATGAYQDQGSLNYGESQVRNLNGIEHRWKLSVIPGDSRPLWDIQPQNGNLTYRLILKNANGQTFADTHSSSDGRGIIALENASAGDYYLHIIPDVGASGEYRVTTWANSIPRINIDWDDQWSYSNIRRWQAYLGSDTKSFYIKWLRTFGDLEINWELRTRGGSLLNSGRSVNGQVSAAGIASEWVDFYITSISGDGSYHIGIYKTPPTLPDTTMPTGNITSPLNHDVVGYHDRTIHFSANASDNSGGSGVKQVLFWVRYGAPYTAEWRLAGVDTSYPYSIDWEIPSDLRSQLIEFGIHVHDNAGNHCIDPDFILGNPSCGIEGSKRIITYLEAWNNPPVNENWISKDWRFYLNQRSLDPNLAEADLRCGGASAAMALAMTGGIAGNYTTMKDHANEIYNAVKDDVRASTLADYLRNKYSSKVLVQYGSYYGEDGWLKIMSEIDAGHPLILISPKITRDGHYIVIVGYRYDGNKHEIIAYDPFGKWLGFREPPNYDMNLASPDSFKGQWTYYSFDDVWGQTGWNPFEWNVGYLITIKPKILLNQSSLDLSVQLQKTDPDMISKESPTVGTYRGIPIATETKIFLPSLHR